ncbi:MAG: hypothetical protein ACRCVG_06795 [Methanobacteriaceae archaeon]
MEKLKPIKKEIYGFKNWFWILFNSKSYEDALNFIEEIRSDLIYFPPFLGKYLKKEFMPIYKKYLAFLKKDYNGKLPQTNNKTENYIGNTMPKADKNKYRTTLGFINQIYYRSGNWIKNVKKQLTN